jgi:hypothetical protein
MDASSYFLSIFVNKIGAVLDVKTIVGRWLEMENSQSEIVAD